MVVKTTSGWGFHFRFVFCTVTICNDGYTGMTSFADSEGQSCHFVCLADCGGFVIFWYSVRFYTSYIGTIFHFFPYVRVSPTICPREIFGKVLISCSRDIWGQSVHPSKISSRHNARPEVDINKRSTAFFTVRRPLGDGINNCRQGGKWAKPKKCHVPKISKPQFLENSSMNILEIFCTRTDPTL